MPHLKLNPLRSFITSQALSPFLSWLLSGFQAGEKGPYPWISSPFYRIVADAFQGPLPTILIEGKI